MSDKYAALRAAAEKAGGDEWQSKKISGENYVIRKGSYKAEYGFKTYQPIGEFDDKAVRDFIVATSPATILALLAEHEADKARIAELTSALNVANERYENRAPTEWAYNQACAAIEKHRARADNAEQRIAVYSDAYKEASHDSAVHWEAAASLAEENSELKQRIAELESRKVNLPSLNPQMFNDDVMFGYRKAQKEAVEFCAAAGITLETGERS